MTSVKDFGLQHYLHTLFMKNGVHCRQNQRNVLRMLHFKNFFRGLFFYFFITLSPLNIHHGHGKFITKSISEAFGRSLKFTFTNLSVFIAFSEVKLYYLAFGLYPTHSN